MFSLESESVFIPLVAQVTGAGAMMCSLESAKHLPLSHGSTHGVVSTAEVTGAGKKTFPPT